MVPPVEPEPKNTAAKKTGCGVPRLPAGREAGGGGRLEQREVALRGVRQALILKRASPSRTSGEWNDDFDVLANGIVVGRIFKANASPVGGPWVWTLTFGHHEDRTPTRGYAATRQAAMTAFAKSWRRE